MKSAKNPPIIKAVASALAFLARHFLFVVLAMLLGCVLWTVVYLVLLVIAVVANQGLGGPMAYPAGLVAVVLSCVFLGWGVFAPATALGAIACGLLRWPRLAAIPLVYFRRKGWLK